MLTSLLLSFAVVVSLALTLLIAPALLLQRFLSRTTAFDDGDEIEDRWATVFSDSPSSLLPVDRVTA